VQINRDGLRYRLPLTCSVALLHCGSTSAEPSLSRDHRPQFKIPAKIKTF
jgi:hypothetical protein